MINKKLRKLKNNPSLFFQDMIEKRVTKFTQKFKKFRPKKKQGYYGYTVVSAVYNVEKYLDDYFKSLVSQNLDFRNNINLIMVDDGSTDNSAQIIKKWQSKYPNNITYIYKENGGQASARNLGLEYVKSDWVTFIDPDDFINPNYFLEIDNYLDKNKNIQIIGCKLVFFYQNNNSYKDNHPLNNKFANDNSTHVIKNLNSNLQLSVATAFFNTQIIFQKNIKFNEHIKPSFEDAKFIADFMLYTLDANMAFISKAKYFYRKREDGTSTLDSSMYRIGTYDNVLRHGLLDMLKAYQGSFSQIPQHIQNMALYHLIWQLKYLINNPEKISFLTQEQKKNYLDLLDEIFSHIDSQSIMKFHLAGTWFYHKVGMLGCFKKEKPAFQICYIEEIDAKKRQICLVYFTPEEVFESIQLDGVDIIPDFAKTVQHDFVDRVFVYEQRLWIHIPLSAKKLKVFIDEKQALITYAGKQHQELDLAALNKAFSNDLSIYNANENIWLLMDKDIQADDNAEHLYRYIAQTHPEQSIYFALRSSSHDWDRLKNEGFALLDFGTAEFEKVFKKSSKIISSHIDGYIVNYFGKDTLKGKEFIFLQHGVIQNDLSKWLNPKKMDLFVTTTKAEYNSIASDFNRYKFSKKNVIQTGLPRHDTLLAHNNENSKTILIMPTWRKYIMGKQSGNIATQRELNPDFLTTDYAQHWLSFLKNPKLQHLAEENGFKVVYFPHANIQPYLSQFDLPSYIDVLDHASIKIQELFQQASFMITDYSSVAFEMGVLNKTVLYYQFDEDLFASGSHTSQKGYFDYRQHGFGPVVTNELDLFIELEKILLNKGKPAKTYQNRIEQTFTFRDSHNCRRVFDAIVDLDLPYDENSKDPELAIKYTMTALKYQNWRFAESKWAYVKNVLNISQPLVEEKLQKDVNYNIQEDIYKIAKNIWDDGDYVKAYQLLTMENTKEAQTKEEYMLKIKLALLNNDIDLAKKCLSIALSKYENDLTDQEWFGLFFSMNSKPLEK